MTFQSEEEARAALEERRGRLISLGHQIAIELAQKYGAVHGQMVIAEMTRRSLFTPEDEEHSHHWLACIFKNKGYRESWEKLWHVKVGNKERNVHAAPRMLWKLKGAPDPGDGAFERVTEEDCPVCGRKDDGRPPMSVIRRAYGDIKIALNYSASKGMRPKHEEQVAAFGKWIRGMMEKDEQTSLFAGQKGPIDDRQ
jgi:hypothetical protein